MGLFVVFAPSGTGKTTLCRKLVADNPRLHFSISHTTRPMRAGEEDGTDYLFIDQTAFDQLRVQGAFAEYAQVYGNWYGTSHRQLDNQLKKSDVLLEIDWQGAQQIRRTRQDAVLIGILPPSVATVRQRLLARGKDSTEVIDSRMQSIADEITHLDQADYLVMNDDLSQAMEHLRTIVAAYRLSYKAMQAHHQTLIDQLGTPRENGE